MMEYTYVGTVHHTIQIININEDDKGKKTDNSLDCI